MTQLTNWKQEKCWKCDCDIEVPTSDIAPRYYCYPCARDVMADVRIPNEPIEVSHE